MEDKEERNKQGFRDSGIERERGYKIRVIERERETEIRKD